MNDKKFAFVMCANNEQYEKEALYYIERLEVPEGYSCESVVIREAESMAEGYNRAMQLSDARYKIYMHQDVMITEKKFLKKILSLFKNREIGMIGLVGSPVFPENGVMWYGDRIGSLYTQGSEGYGTYIFGQVAAPCEYVEAVDGFLMITQYDVPWRADIFKKWDFYDVSQCFEFSKRGYKIAVPAMLNILVNAKNFCKNIEIVDKSSFYKKDIKQMEKGTDIFNSIIMRKEAGMAVLRVQ